MALKPTIDRPNYEVNTAKVSLRAGVPILGTWVLMLLAFLLPAVDSTRPPFFDLKGGIAQVALFLSQTGSKFGIPVIALSMIALVVTRSGIARRRRWQELIVLVSIMAIFGGAFAAFNENLLKEWIKIPRPNIVWLAGEDGTGPLGMTAEAFYKSGKKETRSNLLAQTLEKDPAPVRLSAAIEEHWIHETGYSFPSGHAFSSMFFASFLLAIAVTYASRKRYWIFYIVLPWALGVCYSRSILRVHTPADIAMGSLLGVLAAIAAWAAVRRLIRAFTLS